MQATRFMGGAAPVQRITFAFGEGKTCDVMWQAVGSM